jgi:hypothetical protein
LENYLISAKIPFFLIDDWYVSHNPVEIGITNNFIVIITHSSGVLVQFPLYGPLFNVQ